MEQTVKKNDENTNATTSQPGSAVAANTNDKNSSLFSTHTTIRPTPAPLNLPLFGTVTTNDNVPLYWERFGSSGHVVVLIHGWSGSRHYWDQSVRPIARTCQVITYDLRHHGDSGKPTYGYHVARLAADLRDLLSELNLDNVTLVGSSMGAAIIWSYFELFAGERISSAVFIDQAPLQNLTMDWKAGSTGCYDIASLTRLQCRLLADFTGFSKDNALHCCSSDVVSQEVLAALQQETLKASPNALAELMADHTALDWRPTLPRIGIPCLNLVGRRSAVFPWWGCEEVSRLIPDSRTLFFENENHWLYIEQPQKFAGLIAAFVNDGFRGVDKVWVNE